MNYLEKEIIPTGRKLVEAIGYLIPYHSTKFELNKAVKKIPSTYLFWQQYLLSYFPLWNILFEIFAEEWNIIEIIAQRQAFPHFRKLVASRRMRRSKPHGTGSYLLIVYICGLLCLRGFLPAECTLFCKALLSDDKKRQCRILEHLSSEAPLRSCVWTPHFTGVHWSSSFQVTKLLQNSHIFYLDISRHFFVTCDCCVFGGFLSCYLS